MTDSNNYLDEFDYNIPNDKNSNIEKRISDINYGIYDGVEDVNLGDKLDEIRTNPDFSSKDRIAARQEAVTNSIELKHKKEREQVMRGLMERWGEASELPTDYSTTPEENTIKLIEFINTPEGKETLYEQLTDKEKNSSNPKSPEEIKENVERITDFLNTPEGARALDKHLNNPDNLDISAYSKVRDEQVKRQGERQNSPNSQRRNEWKQKPF